MKTKFLIIICFIPFALCQAQRFDGGVMLGISATIWPQAILFTKLTWSRSCITLRSPLTGITDGRETPLTDSLIRSKADSML